MNEDTILVDRDGPIATVVLNRPHKLNALTKPMWQWLGETMRTLSADDTLRCVVVRGAGGKAFAPGNDISEFENERSSFEQAKAYAEVLHGALGALADCRHPTV
ncbi:MAG: enoyl-CoA hydratase/isomerase family protein, partial [Pseudomonadota bacterium]|nr:enoyl-CoA hydratase/isomerase family protein [Pseudomonadota bacterium]